MNAEKTLIVIAGPTAVGKTAFAIQLAKHFKTEIISADSRQFFRELTIGTAKPDSEELAEIPHHFINTHSISEEYNAGKFEQEASATIDELFLKFDYLILVGGSGLYINAVCDGFDAIPAVDEDIRMQLIDVYKQQGISSLQKQLQELDPTHYAAIDLNNPQRLMRALEICISTGKPYSSFRKGAGKKRKYHIMKIGLNVERELLYDRINARVDEMIDAGLLNEVRELVPYKHFNALQTVGYKELFDYLDDKCTLKRAVELIKQNTRNFAKRQLTWFRRDSEINWFRPEDIQSAIEFISKKSH